MNRQTGSHPYNTAAAAAQVNNKSDAAGVERKRERERVQKYSWVLVVISFFFSFFFHSEYDADGSTDRPTNRKRELAREEGERERGRKSPLFKAVSSCCRPRASKRKASALSTFALLLPYYVYAYTSVGRQFLLSQNSEPQCTHYSFGVYCTF